MVGGVGEIQTEVKADSFLQKLIFSEILEKVDMNSCEISLLPNSHRNCEVTCWTVVPQLAPPHVTTITSHSAVHMCSPHRLSERQDKLP